MRIVEGWVREVRETPGGRAAWITCPDRSIPSPGQYCLAVTQEAILGVPLFQAGGLENGFLAAPPIPSDWHPGMPLRLCGPLGKGFHLPANILRLALVAVGESIACLLPLVSADMARKTAITLFCQTPPPDLPAYIEAYPLSSLAELSSWADFLAIDLPGEQMGWLTELGRTMGKAHCPGQVLIHNAMPCGGLGACGVCAVPVGRKWKLTCSDGPVFDLGSLLERG